MTLRWGILATGTIAATFAEALAATPANRLLAVASRDAERAHRFVDGLDASGISAYGSYEALLADTDVDVVYVATPHPDHATWTLRALDAGKHVLAEKPLGLNHAQVMAAVEAAGSEARFLMEAFMYRCHPQTLELKALIDAGEIGEVRHIDAKFGYHAPYRPGSRLFANALGGGGILDVGCYPVSMARLLIGAEPDEVAGHGRLGTTGVDEWAAALLKFPGGESAQVATSVSLGLENVVRVFGSRGEITVHNPWFCANDTGRWHFELLRDGQHQRIEGEARPLYGHEIEHVSSQIAAGALESPLMSWQDSRGNALVLDAWRRELGLEYIEEQPAHHRGPLRGSLRRRASMPTGTIPGLDKPVSRLVMGCDNQPSMSHAAVMWDHFFEHGGNCFDTAFVYGRGAMEQLLGHWHRRRGLREELIIIGKGAHTPDCLPEKISEQLTVSLERLQSDYVDVYFMHRDNLAVPVGEFVSALNDEVNRGRIRAFGGSNWSLERLRAGNDHAAAHGLQAFSAVSNNFSLAEMVTPIWPGVKTATDADFRSYLLEADMALMPWSSQARGFFTPWADAVIAGGGREQQAITSMQPSIAELKRTWFSESNLARRERAAELAQQRGISMIEIALAYVASQPFQCFPLIGPRALSETTSCMRALEESLSAEEIRWLEAGR